MLVEDSDSEVTGTGVPVWRVPRRRMLAENENDHVSLLAGF